ncbi:MAG TPA: hypothetical protein VFJ85_09640 [Acidimicrobiales bacterium]|nr:hypothetical protein [Acidimicrobiales bacterium]
MPSGTDAGVLALPSVSLVPDPPPPGAVLVPASDAAASALVLAGALGAGPPLTEDEAAAELAERRQAALAPLAERVRRLGEEARAARVQADAAVDAHPGLRTLPRGLTSHAVRDTAHAVHLAAERLREARDAVGARPSFDAAAAAQARAAQADVEHTRWERGDALRRTLPVLAAANLLAACIVAGRLATEAFDAAMLLVAVLPLLGLAFTATSVAVPAHHARLAARRRWSALRSMNVSTLAGLTVLEERAAAWDRRAARVTAAEEELRAAGGAWRTLVGGTVALTSADRLAADLDIAERAAAPAVAAETAWAEAAAGLQAAEDTFGAGHPPLVVVDPDPTVAAVTRLATLRRLALLGGATPVILVGAGMPAAVEAGAPVAGDTDRPPARHRVRPPAAPAPPPARRPVREPVAVGAWRAAASAVPSRPPSPAPAGAARAAEELGRRVRSGLVKLKDRAQALRAAAERAGPARR